MKSKKDPARPPDLRRLARRIVDDRLAYFTTDPMNFIWPELLDNGDFETLRDAAFEEDDPGGPDRYPGLERQLDKDGQHTLMNLQEANARAGFLLGLELGRRLGGAR